MSEWLGVADDWARYDLIIMFEKYQLKIGQEILYDDKIATILNITQPLNTFNRYLISYPSQTSNILIKKEVSRQDLDLENPINLNDIMASDRSSNSNGVSTDASTPLTNDYQFDIATPVAYRHV